MYREDCEYKDPLTCQPLYPSRLGSILLLELSMDTFSRFSKAQFYPLTGYKLKSAPIPAVLDHCTAFENYNVCPSEPCLHCLLFHWLRVECHSLLLAPCRYENRYNVIGVHLLRMCAAAWNTGTCMYMIWTGLGCLVQCISSIVWDQNIVNRAPIYCDIGKPLDASFSSVHSLSVIPQRLVFKLRSMLQSRLVHFASTAASTRLQRRRLS